MEKIGVCAVGPMLVGIVVINNFKAKIRCESVLALIVLILIDVLHLTWFVLGINRVEQF